MKIRFLGTAASEGFPAVFCNCEYCNEARRLGGKNIRTRSQTIINDDLLIDLPADTYFHFLSNGIKGDEIKYLFVTHSHSDHFYLNELEIHNGCYAKNMRSETLDVYCNKGTFELIEKMPIPNINKTKLIPFEQVVVGNYKVTALPARHYFGDEALFYIIEQDGKTLLYAHDTGYFYEEVFDFIKDKKFFFDLVSFDCTNVDIPISDEGTHMGIPNIERVAKRLSDMGAINDNTVKTINHFSHNGNPLQETLENRVKDLGYLVSFDGMSIEI